ncbi:protein atonal homolog 8 isoform X1 [Orussus abietinus]|uniref:protein atonal homolog 8 isoform X1 n=1 Tax=Orussus abietinus TaxID=222816 RepID=UPI000626AF56|nr:protein atonal homolog 8 isoform X1 [Orussus abietinus]
MTAHVVESTCELSAFMKAGVMAGSERDAGFCSGADEDDMSGLHSPSASEDSVEVQVTPISLRNKRKLAEPRKIQEPNSAPLKKRRFEQIEEPSTVVDEESRPAGSPSPSPFRPWSTGAKTTENKPTVVKPTPSLPTSEDDAQRTQARLQDDPLQRLQSNGLQDDAASTPDGPYLQFSPQRRDPRKRLDPPPPPLATPALPHPRLQEEPLALVLRGEVSRVPSHPAVSGSFDVPSSSSSSSYHPTDVLSHPGQAHSSHSGHQPRHQGGQQRNYKNMTRERRIEANARERTRVHTISAAFDTLRRAIPAYSHNQKLSKLSVLRIACSYIMTLGKIVNTPEGETVTGAPLGACVDLVSRTIQTEGKLRKKKDE